jgi:hypothetical protein
MRYFVTKRLTDAHRPVDEQVSWCQQFRLNAVARVLFERQGSLECGDATADNQNLGRVG